MPVYCYRKPDGSLLELEMTIAEMTARSDPKNWSIEVEGERCERDWQAEQCGGHLPAGWPIWSDAAGFHPDQRGDAMEYLAKSGCPTYINELGQVKMDNRAHRKRILRALHLRDNNGGYGD